MGSSFILVQSMYFKLAVWNENDFQVEFNMQVAFLQSLKSNQVYQLSRQFILKMDHPDSSVLFWKRYYAILLHSPSKCLARVKKCRHVWLNQNFDPSLLTNKVWLIFMGMKHFFFLKKKFQNGWLKKTVIFKTANSQNLFAKMS